MSEVVIWIVAAASAILLIAGGFTLALSRLRGQLAASRRQVSAAEAQVAAATEDPFGELKVIADQLQRLRRRLDQVGAGAGRPADPNAPAAPRPPAQVAATSGDGTKQSAVATELEADLELFKREVYTKTRRIDELEAEKQHLAEKIVGLEEQLGRAALAPAAPGPGPTSPRSTQEAPGPSEELVGLIDTLQQEADALRQQITERDQRIRSLETDDSTGLVHEMERIRKELKTRNEEVGSLRDNLTRSDRGAAQAKSRAGQLEQEKESVAARALESAAELRRAQEQIRSLERQLASRVPGPLPGRGEAPGQPKPTSPWPTQAPTTSPGAAPRLTRPPAPTPQGMPQAETQTAARGTPPPAPGVPRPRPGRTPFDRPDAAATLKTGPPLSIPPKAPSKPPPSRTTGAHPKPAQKRKRRTTGSIFPLPHSKEEEE